MTDERVKCRGYRFAVQWCADNDEGAERDPEVVAETISVSLVADLFGVTTDKVARDVLRLREKEDNGRQEKDEEKEGR